MRIPLLIALLAIAGPASAFGVSVEVQVDDTSAGWEYGHDEDQAKEHEDTEEVRVWFYNDTAIIVRHQGDVIYEDSETILDNPDILLQMDEKICRVASYHISDLSRMNIDPDNCYLPIVYRIING